MPGKRAQLIVHHSPSTQNQQLKFKRRKTSRFYSPRSKPDDPYVTESGSESEGSEEQVELDSHSRSKSSLQSTTNQTTTSGRSFTSRTFTSNSPQLRKTLLRSRNLLGISTTRRDTSSSSSSGFTQQRPPRLRQRTRTNRPLSPLPVSHYLARGRSSSAKKMPVAAANNNKRSRDPSVIPSGIRITRRTSGVIGPPKSETATPDPKRKRSSGKLVESDSSSEEEEEGDEEVFAMEKQGQIEGGERDEEEEDSTETEGEEQDATDALGSDSASKLRAWPTTKLRTLRRPELVDLFLALPSSSTSQPDTVSMTKDSLIAAILSARNPSSSSTVTSERASSTEEDSADASPRPRTSHEPSPEDEIRPRRARRSSSNARARTTVTKKRASDGGARKHPLTPPLTSGEEDNNKDENAMVEDAEETSRSMGRRNSRTEMPPPPLPTAGTTRQHRRTRSNANELADTSNVIRFGKRLSHIIQEEEEGGLAKFTSPVAHRTRGHRPSSHPDQTSSAAPRTIVANAQGSPARPLRAAKQKAVARIKGKARAEAEEDEQMDLDEDDDGEGDALVSSSSEPEKVGTRKNGAPGRRRRSSRNSVKQVETPPSDADEESGGEEEHVVEMEARSNLRAGGRGGKHGKVVKLRNGSKSKRDGEEDAEPELGEDDDEDEDMEADYEEEYEEEEEEEQEAEEDDVDLINATSKSLLRCKKDDLVRLCEERDLQNDGRTKKELVDALLQWRDQENYASSQDSDASTNSTLSNASTATARGATKTARLAKASRPSKRTSKDTPLLMRARHSASPEKPRTGDCSKEREHQEDVNALDLESLQLQDKEIPPEKLTKLELVGSGGFKDVYKGTYRRRTIAICDIRGHLTDMDIKELGLLRDLRHENIVQFIGVSIPKQPSAVPVMIVTELCANGDLFDYIRGVEAPQFTNILEIMLGIAKGIEYLHTRTPSIIHRDIKSSNVLITSHGVAKIADFGLARIKTSTKSMIRSLVGTVNWQAPELWHPHPRYNEKVDVYSVALVMWEMLQWHQPVKRYPFEGMNEHAIYADVGQRQLRPSLAGLHRRWGGEIIDLMSTMWEQDYSKRPSMPQVVRRIKQILALEKAKPK
ncbi:uncharacterized protein JCM6883_001117 [Sporobolomyces salmoneus]|uniref:uncharacterized protein n=1 Tax=Sporobolomyces salmoneus TaxID=183962 RepID=UPI00316D25F8